MDKTLKHRPLIKCRFCGKIFQQKGHKKKGTQKFCSRECGRAYIYKQTVKRKCIICGKIFECPIIHKRRITCNVKCYDKYRGSLVIGECKWCGKPVYGRQTTNRDKANLACSKKCHGFYVRWNREPEGYKKKKIWTLIKSEKKIKCEICGIKDVEILTVHHKDKNKKNNAVENLKLLCCNCHFKIHRKGSKAMTEYVKGLEEIYESIAQREGQVRYI